LLAVADCAHETEKMFHHFKVWSAYFSIARAISNCQHVEFRRGAWLGRETFCSALAQCRVSAGLQESGARLVAADMPKAKEPIIYVMEAVGRTEQKAISAQ
jgi:hypothetical protein